MRKSDLNFVVDAIAFACFVFMVATGVIMEYLLPPGSGQHVSIWGLDRHDWGGIHFWLAVVFLAALAVHVYLHWRWIVAVLRRRPSEGSGMRVGLGITALIALLAIALAPLLSPVERETTAVGQADRRWNLSAEIEEIQGAMTLSEVSAGIGVTVESLLNTLGLPRDIPADERLGRLARENGFSVAEVREALEQARSMGGAGHDAAQSVSLRGSASTAERADEREHDPLVAGAAEIRGSMTLGEVITLTGVPLRYLVEQLGLPAGIPASERLGRLARQHGFTLVDVRDVVSSYP